MNKKVYITGWLLFIAILFIEFGVGHYFAATLGIIPVDANSRVASAHYILFSRYPHLGAIGFIWNPLPSLVQLPIMLFKPLYAPIATSALSGVLTTAIFAGLSALLLFRNGVYFGLSTLWSLTLSFLFAINPFILLYGANGMSESLFTCIIILVIISFTRWMADSSTQHIVIMAMGLMLAFLTRYEAVPLSAAIAVCVMIVILRTNESLSLRNRISKLESTWVVLLTPFTFAVLLWLFLNYTLMGDALFFYHSQYSNLSQTQSNEANQEFIRLIGNPILVLLYVFKKMWVFSIPLFFIVLWRIVKRNLFRKDMLILIGLLLSVPSLQIMMLYQGSSNGFLRFFFYSLPILAAWLPYEINLQNKRGKLKKIMISTYVLSLIVSAAMVYTVMKDPNLAPEESDTLLLNNSKTLESSRIAKEIAVYLDKEHPDKFILMDTFSAFQVHLNSRFPKQHIITSDFDFQQYLEAPLSHPLDYLLLPKPEGVAKLNALNQAYPDLFDNGADWCVLEKDFYGVWKLYRVIDSAE